MDKVSTCAGKNVIGKKHKFIIQRVVRKFTLTSVALFTAGAAQAYYHQHYRFDEFANELNKEHGISVEQTKAWLAQAEKKQSVLDATSRPAEKVTPWSDYQDIFLTKKRLKQGQAFMEENAELLAKAEKKYGVPKEIITAIIGVETFYGRIQGRFRVLDSLSTLAFDYPKRPLFWRELKQFLVMSQEEGFEPGDIKGSYAGAMGYGQFIPSSFRHYAIDFDGDGKKDLWANKADAIGSVAHYFNKHGWKTNQPVVQRVRVTGNAYDKMVNDRLKPKWQLHDLTALGVTPTQPVTKDEKVNLIKLNGKHGAEFWLGHNNFYVITRYNHSRRYAMAVYQLSQKLLQ